MIKNLVRRQEDTPSSYVPRYTREHRIKLHHSNWKPSRGTFIDPDLVAPWLQGILYQARGAGRHDHTNRARSVERKE